jgi:hypothetical protein
MMALKKAKPISRRTRRYTKEMLAEGGQLDQVAFRNLLGGLTGFAPGRQSADDDKGAKALLSQ